MKVTDDNKGVKFFHSKPYWNSNSKSGFIPLVAGSLKDQNYFTSILFSIFLSQQKSAETGNRNGNINGIISAKYFIIYTIFYKFPTTNKEALLSRQSLFLDLKLSPHQQRCRCLLNFSLHVSCVLQVQRDPTIPSAAPNNAADTDCSSPVLGSPGAGGVVGVGGVGGSRWWCCWWCWWRCWWCWWCIRRCCWWCCWRNNSVVKLCIFWQLSSSY